MKYTRQVVKEILRYRPPAPMVPQMAQKPFKMTEDYTAPAGTMIVPSVWSACMQVSVWVMRLTLNIVHSVQVTMVF